MNLHAAAAFIFALACFEAVSHAGQGKELSASEFLENLPALLATTPEPPVTEAQLVELEEEDPETYVFIRGAQARPPKPAHLGGDGSLTLSRPDTREKLTARYRRPDGVYDAREIERLQVIMRCGATDKEIAVSIKLLEIMDAAEDKFGKAGLTLLSAYRAPRHNREVPGAARRSLHMLGWAADIRVAGRKPAEVAAFARELGAGGVGYYPDAAFIHLDSGRSRYWEVQAKPKNKKPAGPARERSR